MNVAARLLAVFVTLALVACGGSMEAGVGSGGSGAPVGPLSVGVGSVTGFGSIIVNGERYDETSAEILVDKRPDRPDPATVAAIRLGTHVELQHRNLVVTKATVSAELIGPVASVGASSLVALGQTIRVNGDAAHPTTFDGFSALSDLAAGSVVEVHGDRTDGQILATRIELQPSSTAVVRLAGTATAVNGRSFSIGTLLVDASAATMIPAGAGLAAGQRVVAWTDGPYGGGTLIAKFVRIDTPTIAENASVALDGVVADLRNGTSFRIGGVAVDAAAAVFTGGSVPDLANGRSVRARGSFVGGVLNAAAVDILPMVAAPVQLTGAITDFLDASRPFRIRNTLVRVTPQTTFTGGTTTNLGPGVQVKATGTLADGVVQATLVEFLPVSAGPQRVIVGAVGTPVSAIAADGSRTFRLEGSENDVKTTTATSYRNGSAADIAAGRQVRVKGRLEDALVVAEEVQFLDSPVSTFEIEGIAGNVRSTSMVVNGETVDLNITTTYTLNGEPTTVASLKNGLRVQVLVTKLGGVLTALAVEIRAPESVATTMRGIVSGRTSPSATEFLVGSQRVSVSAATKVLPANRSLADLVNGADVEVQGTIANGVLTATRLQFR